jgi:formate dehydrogenase major subunit
MTCNKDKITLSIDDREVCADAGQTILEVARDNGIEIPTLCHDPRLAPYGSCLVCVVEVEGFSKPVLSCTTEAKAGQKIATESEAIFAARKAALDMLLSNHNADCRGPCYEKCPADVDVQGYLALAHEGRDKEALELIRKTNPLPLVCGRVCVRYCEGACARNSIDESPVAINFIKRYVSDLEHDNLDPPQKAEPNGHKVAIVGGGPGGLTAAYYLAQAGCAVTIFEAHPKLGGMLRYGIPDYRLDQDVMDKEIQYILDHGVEVKTETRLGRDFTLDQLKEQGYDAFFLALGAQKAKSMRVKNEDAPGVVGGIGYLDEVTKDGVPEHTGHVLIVGGGNTAVDASRTALRSGADKVSILYRRTRKEMPADDVEIEDAIEEGVNIDFLIAPTEVLTGDDGRVSALRCLRMELGEPDSSGRRRPVPIEGSEFDIECTLIIAAIGQDADVSGIRGNEKLGEIKESRWATIDADPHSFGTNIDGVFAGGDAVTGPEAAIDAIAHGRKGAEALLRYLGEKAMPKVIPEFLSRQQNVPESYWERFDKTQRATMRQKPVAERIVSFEEVDVGIDPDKVVAETGRCISCGCSDVFTCELKKYASDYQVEQTRFAGKAMRFEPDTRHPFITLDPNKCIVCGRCVRTCDDLQGVAALGFVNRGFDMIVKPSMGKPLAETSCISCGNCIEACPTGAITFKLPFERPGPWRTAPSESVCNYCSVGCNLVFNKTNDAMWNVTAREQDAWTPGELCVRGRFGHREILEEQRLTEAKRKNGAGHQPISVEEAVKQAASGLKAVADKHGPESLGFFISPKATNEETFLFQRLAREVFGTNNIASLYDLTQIGLGAELDEMFGVTASTISREQVEEADVVVVINSNVADENPVLGFAVQRAFRGGAELVIVGPTSTSLNRRGVRWLDTRRGSNTQLLEGLAAELLRVGAIDKEALAKVEGFTAWAERQGATLAQTAKATGLDKDAIKQLAELLGDKEQNVVFVYNGSSVLDKCPGDLEAIGALLLATGRVGREKNGLLLCHEHSNYQGHKDLFGDSDAVGRLGAKLAGAKSVAELDEALQQRKLKGLFIFGEDFAVDKQHQELLAEAEFVVVCDMFETDTSALAHVVIPGSAYAEAAGSVTTLDRTVRAFEPVFPAPAGKSGFELLAEIFGLAAGTEVPSLEAVRAQIGEANPRYAKLASLSAGESHQWNENGGGSVLFAERFLTADAAARFPGERNGAPATQDGKRVCYSTIERMYRRTRSHLLLPNKQVDTSATPG